MRRHREANRPGKAGSKGAVIGVRVRSGEKQGRRETAAQERSRNPVARQ